MNIKLGQEISSNGHETKAETAIRNLSISIEKLIEMRWMMITASGPAIGLAAFDEGIDKLRDALSTLRT